MKNSERLLDWLAQPLGQYMNGLSIIGDHPQSSINALQ